MGEAKSKAKSGKVMHGLLDYMQSIISRTRKGQPEDIISIPKSRLRL